MWMSVAGGLAIAGPRRAGAGAVGERQRGQAPQETAPADLH
jgi:hypothetical protein